jgi:hypothetical protein
MGAERLGSRRRISLLACGVLVTVLILTIAWIGALGWFAEALF